MKSDFGEGESGDGADNIASDAAVVTMGIAAYTVNPIKDGWLPPEGITTSGVVVMMSGILIFLLLLSLSIELLSGTTTTCVFTDTCVVMVAPDAVCC